METKDRTIRLESQGTRLLCITRSVITRSVYCVLQAIVYSKPLSVKGLSEGTTEETLKESFKDSV